MSSRVCATGHIKDSVPLVKSSRALCPGGGPPSFIRSRSEDGLIYRQGITPPLKLTKPNCSVCYTGTSPAVCRQLGDVAIVLDGSRQVGQRTWDEMIRLVQDVTRLLVMEDGLARVAAIVYSDRAREEFSFTRWYTPQEVTTLPPGKKEDILHELVYIGTLLF